MLLAVGLLFRSSSQLYVSSDLHARKSSHRQKVFAKTTAKKQNFSHSVSMNDEQAEYTFYNAADKFYNRSPDFFPEISIKKAFASIFAEFFEERKILSREQCQKVFTSKSNVFAQHPKVPISLHQKIFKQNVVPATKNIGLTNLSHSQFETVSEHAIIFSTFQKLFT